MTSLAAIFSGAQPTLECERLRLNPFSHEDAPRVEALLIDPAIARSTLSIPHPYPVGAALPWIVSHAEAWREGREGTWAVTRRAGGTVVGALSLRMAAAHLRGEVGYWISRDEWGRGYATEALRRLVAFAFDEVGLHRVQAHHFVENPASGRVMARAGMRAEGTRRGAVFREGVPRDLTEYAILRSDPRP